MVAHTEKMNGTPKSTCPLLSVEKHFFFQKQASHSSQIPGHRGCTSRWENPVDNHPHHPTAILCPSHARLLQWHVVSHLPLVLLHSPGHLWKIGSASQWYLSAPPVKIKWMNHAHRLCLRHGCLWLPSNFTTFFPVSAKFDRGENTFQDTKFSQVLENRHPHRRNWQCNYRKGSRTSSALTRPRYTLQRQGNHVSLGLQLMEVLDSMAKCVPAWVVGGVTCAFFPTWSSPAGSGSHFPFPEVPYPAPEWKM